MCLYRFDKFKAKIDNEGLYSDNYKFVYTRRIRKEMISKIKTLIICLIRRVGALISDIGTVDSDHS